MLNTLYLFIEINNDDFVFIVGEKKENRQFHIIYKKILPIQGVGESVITNFDLVLRIFKTNILSIEQKLNFTFKEIILIIDYFNISFINLTGFKKLNGTQILKENITYILNSLKSHITKNESKKNIIHIFNSKYILDKKEMENLPIGLFGDFYSHELSFCLMNTNDLNNLNNILDKCNLKIKKIYLKNYIKGSYLNKLSEKYNTFFFIKIEKKNSQIFFFKNSSLLFEQNFKFGTDLVIKDLMKITSLKKDIIDKIIVSYFLNQNINDEELVEKEMFQNENFRKIKKKILFQIANARIEELLEKFLIKNINLSGFQKNGSIVIFEISDHHHLKCFQEIYRHILEKNNFKIEFKDKISVENLIINANNIYHYGWRKEAIPVTNTKKSVISKFFDLLFK